MKIMQIVGYKNSGKTTVAKRLIELLSMKSVRVASLKHHGHGGVPLGFEATDSEEHRQAGALIAGVEGAGVVQLSNHHAWRMEQMVAIYKLLHIEVLMMEGFKTYDYDKIVLIRDDEDLHLLEQLTHIKAVITPLDLNQSSYAYPIFKQDGIESFNNWFISYLKL